VLAAGGLAAAVLAAGIPASAVPPARTPAGTGPAGATAEPPAGATAGAGGPLHVRLRVVAEGLPGALNRLTAMVSTAPDATCRLSVSEAAATRSFASSRPGSVAWRWMSAMAGSRGAWSFVAICRAGPRWARWRYRTQIGLPHIGGAFVSAPGIAGAQPSPPIPPGTGSCDSQGICFGADPFPPGQCTWYALGRRPDLAGIVRGNASQWLKAAAGKAREGTHAAAGALAVWAADTGPAGADGHVALVAAVRGGRLLLDDSNWRPTAGSPGLQVHEHWAPADSVEGYIYPPG